MNMEFLATLISVLISAIGGSLALNELVRKFFYKLLKKDLPKKTYSERLSELTHNLTKSSSEVDNILNEMAQVAKERETSVRELEVGLSNLEMQEKELKEKIALLQTVPIPVAEHFAKLVAPGEKRSARRDYLLFMAGVIFTTIIAIILQLVFKK